MIGLTTVVTVVGLTTVVTVVGLTTIGAAAVGLTTLVTVVWLTTVVTEVGLTTEAGTPTSRLTTVVTETGWPMSMPAENYTTLGRRITTRLLIPPEIKITPAVRSPP